MRNHFFHLLALVASLAAISANAEVKPKTYPDNGGGATPFDWQKEWGSIHMNSFADGLNDPGAPATVSGSVPCENPKNLATVACKVAKPTPAQTSTTVAPGQLGNAIKYDIKRSFLGCVARAVPNYASENQWDSDTSVCIPSNGGLFSLEELNQANGTHIPHDYQGPGTHYDGTQSSYGNTSVDLKRVLYLPAYDPRGNDDRNSGSLRGCQQQVTNNCAVNDKGDLIRDVHACINVPAGSPVNEGPGYMYPVSHTFSPQEVADLKASAVAVSLPAVSALPAKYFAYQTKDSNGKIKDLLSVVDPTKHASNDYFKGLVDGSVKTINTIPDDASPDHFLNNLKSYRFGTLSGDMTKFIVMDPKDFFDLRLYSTGGAYDAGYDDQAGYKLANGSPAPPGTCPILGTKDSGGYDGICDPDGKAGCNLPIYGEQGEPTVFTDAESQSYSYSNYPLKWSGYVKQWALITKEQYLRNICGSGYPCHNTSALDDREDYYFVDEADGLNDNPVLMVTRAPEYCELAEMSSSPRSFTNQGKPVVADMPCIQYLQYESWVDEDGNTQWSFADLYNPAEALFATVHPETSTMQLFEVKQSGANAGDPNYSKPITGTGSNKFVGTYGTASGKYLRFLDSVDPKSREGTKTFIDPDGNPTVSRVYKDENGTDQNAVKIDRVTVLNTAGEDTVGEYLVGHVASGPNKGQFCKPGKGTDASCVAEQDKGVGFSVKPGAAAAVRMKNPVNILGADGKIKSSTCVIVAYVPPVDSTGAVTKQNMFIPTNSGVEFQAFVASMQNKDKPLQGAGFWDCTSAYQHKDETKRQMEFEGQENTNHFTNGYTDPVTKATTTFKTWAGTLNCNDVVSRPACNQVRMISAQRRCQFENGANGKESDCAGAVDPDDPAVAANNPAKWYFKNEQVQGDVWDSPVEDNSNMFFRAACFASSDSCPAADVPGGHVFCLSPDTLISMADGSKKPIKDVKAGDEVVSFNAKTVRSNALGTAIVQATAITKKQDIIQINDLRITPLHKMVLSTGRAVPAKDIKVGDKLLTGTGKVETVKSVKTKNKKITVYNLVLEKKSDGYIAGGLRVMSYPLMKEMEIISGHASAKKARGGATRNVSSLKRKHAQ